MSLPSEMISLKSSAYIHIVTEKCQKPKEMIKKQFIFKLSATDTCILKRTAMD